MSQGKGGGNKAGSYRGGIRTVEDLRQRCRIDEETGCWNWGLSVSCGAPKVCFRRDDGTVVMGRGRRMALLLAGRDLPKGHQAYAKPECKSDMCVNPDHCASGTLAKARNAVAKAGWLKNRPAKLAALAKATDARRKLTDEAVAEIRASDLSNAKMGEKFGVSGFAVWCVRAGKSYRPKWMPK